MKKFIAIVLIITTAFCFVGCNKGESVPPQNSFKEDNVTGESVPPQNSFKEDNVTGESVAQNSSEENNVRTENVKIDSLDKLNYYAVKKAIAENETALLSNSSPKPILSDLANNTQSKVLNLAKTTAAKIDSNSTFTITMYSYFTITLSDSKGFLAQKLGGTGSVEVVITKNNFNNMITFKRGDKYYSCFETSSTDNAMSFSSSKYVMGYYLIENKNQENYELTVYFEGDRVIGLNCVIFEQCGNHEYVVDKIKLNNHFSFILHKNQSFTANQLENLFLSNNSFVDDGIVLEDGTILFGQASVTTDAVAFKNSSGKSLIINNQIKRVSALQNNQFGFCIRLELTSDIKLSDKTNIDLYLEGFKQKQLTLQKVSEAVYITNFSSKFQMSDLYYILTATNSGNRIGNIKTQNDFVREMSKKIDLKDYNLSTYDYTDDTGYKDLRYSYTLKKAKSRDYDKYGYQITIDGINITFPIRVSELLDMGFSLNKRKGDAVYFNTPEGNLLDTMAFDLYGDASDFNDRYIAYVGFQCYKKCCSYHKAVNATLPNFEMIKGINKDSTLDEIISKLGAPDRIMTFVSEAPQNIYYNYEIQLAYEFTAGYASKAILSIDIKPLLNNGAPSDLISDIIFTFEAIEKNN